MKMIVPNTKSLIQKTALLSLLQTKYVLAKYSLLVNIKCIYMVQYSTTVRNNMLLHSFLCKHRLFVISAEKK